MKKNAPKKARVEVKVTKKKEPGINFHPKEEKESRES
jgi:hypothetical protein